MTLRVSIAIFLAFFFGMIVAAKIASGSRLPPAPIVDLCPKATGCINFKDAENLIDKQDTRIFNLERDVRQLRSEITASKCKRGYVLWWTGGTNLVCTRVKDVIQ